MSEFKDGLDALEKSGAKQTNYWNILLAVTIGVITAAATEKVNTTYLSIGYVFFGLANLQAVDGFQKELIILKKHLEDYRENNSEAVSDTQSVIFDCKRILKRWHVIFFHISILLLCMLIINAKYLSSIFPAA